MSMKPRGDSAEVIQFPAHRVRKSAAATARTRVAGGAATADQSARTNALLAAAEGCWYHGEAVSEAQRKH